MWLCGVFFVDGVYHVCVDVHRVLVFGPAAA